VSRPDVRNTFRFVPSGCPQHLGFFEGSFEEVIREPWRLDRVARRNLMNRRDRAINGFLIGALLGVVGGFLSIQLGGNPQAYGEAGMKQAYHQVVVIFPTFVVAGGTLGALIGLLFSVGRR
jgi:hypothetical protein